MSKESDKYIDCPLPRDEQVAIHVANLIAELIDSGIDEGTHYRIGSICRNENDNDNSNWFVIKPASVEEIRSVNINKVFEFLKEDILISLGEICVDLEEQNIKL